MEPAARQVVYEIVVCPRCRAYWSRPTMAANTCPYCRHPLSLVLTVPA